MSPFLLVTTFSQFLFVLEDSKQGTYRSSATAIPTVNTLTLLLSTCGTLYLLMSANWHQTVSSSSEHHPAHLVASWPCFYPSAQHFFTSCQFPHRYCTSFTARNCTLLAVRYCSILSRHLFWEKKKKKKRNAPRAQTMVWPPGWLQAYSVAHKSLWSWPGVRTAAGTPCVASYPLHPLSKSRACIATPARGLMTSRRHVVASRA